MIGRLKSTNRFASVVVVAAMVLSGCQHFRKSAAKPTDPASTDQPIPIAASTAAGTESGTAEPVSLRAGYDEFYVGPIADPDDREFTYRPGGLFVLRRPEGLGFEGPTNGDISFSPATASRMANDHPEPTNTELAAIAFRSQQALAALTEENNALLAQIRDSKKPAVLPNAPPPHPAISGSSAPEAKESPAPAKSDAPDDERLNAIAPNGDYVIELDPRLFAVPNQTTTNPFVQLYRPPVTWHETDLVVSAAVPGPNPSAILNDEPYSVGEKFKELTVYRIDPDTVYLRKDSFLLACPVSVRTLKLRLP